MTTVRIIIIIIKYQQCAFRDVFGTRAVSTLLRYVECFSEAIGVFDPIYNPGDTTLKKITQQIIISQNSHFLEQNYSLTQCHIRT